jgi:hypothetical protein
MSEILSSSSHGIDSISWIGTGGGDWLPTQDPAVKTSAQNFTALAAHADGRAYGLVGWW